MSKLVQRIIYKIIFKISLNQLKIIFYRNEHFTDVGQNLQIIFKMLEH